MDVSVRLSCVIHSCYLTVHVVTSSSNAAKQGIIFEKPSGFHRGLMYRTLSKERGREREREIKRKTDKVRVRVRVSE